MSSKAFQTVITELKHIMTRGLPRPPQILCGRLRILVGPLGVLGNHFFNPPSEGARRYLNERKIDSNTNPILQDRILEPGRIPEIPVWFPDVRLNYAENLLYRRDDGTALTEGGESGIVTHTSFRQLYARVQEMAAALRVNGLQVGDRVAGKFRSACLVLRLGIRHSFPL